MPPHKKPPHQTQRARKNAAKAAKLAKSKKLQKGKKDIDPSEDYGEFEGCVYPLHTRFAFFPLFILFLIWRTQPSLLPVWILSIVIELMHRRNERMKNERAIVIMQLFRNPPMEEILEFEAFAKEKDFLEDIGLKLLSASRFCTMVEYLTYTYILALAMIKTAIYTVLFHSFISIMIRCTGPIQDCHYQFYLPYPTFLTIIYLAVSSVVPEVQVPLVKEINFAEPTMYHHLPLVVLCFIEALCIQRYNTFYKMDRLTRGKIRDRYDKTIHEAIYGS